MSDKINTSIRQLFEILLLAAPYIAVLLGFFWLFRAWGLELSWTAAITGSMGWVLAYLLRIPASVIARTIFKEPKTIETWVVSCSGPLEELIRLGVLLAIGREFDLAYSIGLGWGGVEVLYVAFNDYVITGIMKRTDEEAIAQQIALREAGMIHEWSTPLGVVERASSTAFHIGSTLLIAKWPWFTTVSMVLHSALNLTVRSIARDRVFVTQVLIATVGSLFFLAGTAGFNLH
jgi:hypothetical protein